MFNNYLVLYTYAGVSEESPDIEMFNVMEFNNSDDVVSISEVNVYSETLKQDMARSRVGINLPVVGVNNYTYTLNGVVHGICWASCIGSLSSFYNNPTTGGSADDASNIRYAAISKYGNTGTINTVVSGVSYYANVTLTAANGRLTWNALKTKIANRAPAYTGWTTTAGAAGHAMVLKGYLYENTDPNNTAYYSIYVMDPNYSTTTTTLISYNGTYSINGNPYSWTSTAYKA